MARPALLGPLAAGATAGGLAFAALTAWAVSGDLPAFDRELNALALRAEQPALVWIADRPLDWIAEPGIVLLLAGTVGVALARLRWWVALATLAAAMLVIALGGAEAKEELARARPVANLDEAANEALPSGHARFSVFWTWLAVLAATRLTPGRRRVALVAAGVILTLAAGAARIYLRAHWPTDVLAGWAFGAAAFCLAGVVALVATRAWTARRRAGASP